MRIGDRAIAPIIGAASPEEAAGQARVLGYDMSRKRARWLRAKEMRRPQTVIKIIIGEPVMLHAGHP
jgi:hypothetical protein